MCKNRITKDIEGNKNEINQQNDENKNDFKEDKFFIIETLKSLQFSFYYDDEERKSNLFGIFNIDKIYIESPEYIDEKKLEKFEIFYDYYNNLFKEKEPEDCYYEKINK